MFSILTALFSSFVESEQSSIIPYLDFLVCIHSHNNTHVRSHVLPYIKYLFKVGKIIPQSTVIHLANLFFHKLTKGVQCLYAWGMKNKISFSSSAQNNSQLLLIKLTLMIFTYRLNQFQAHLDFTQNKIIKFCQELRIILPISH